MVSTETWRKAAIHTRPHIIEDAEAQRQFFDAGVYTAPDNGVNRVDAAADARTLPGGGILVFRERHYCGPRDALPFANVKSVSTPRLLSWSKGTCGVGSGSGDNAASARRADCSTASHHSCSDSLITDPELFGDLCEGKAAFVEVGGLGTRSIR